MMFDLPYGRLKIISKYIIMLSFMNFLKKYSNVPNQFIDDFF